jgi:sugar phosphate isomerase/epimerase
LIASHEENAGSPFLDFESALKEINRLGYDGIEVPFKFTLLIGENKFLEMLQMYNLKVIFQVFTDGPVVPGSGIVFGGPYPGFTTPSSPGESDKHQLVTTHLQVFKEQVEAAQKFNPTLVNSHSLKDYFTEEMANEFFTEALAWQKEKGYRVLHETHRKRYLHSPWVARGFVPNFPELKLVADLSHWINIAETNTTDPDLTRVIEKFAARFEHTHCRVGYDHGPQVPDPRAKCWLEYMEGHERWWDAIWLSLAEAGCQEVTMTPEHGPPNYQVCDPKTGTPLADIWDVNHWIALRRQERFAFLFGEENTSKVIPSPTQGSEPRTLPGPSILMGKEDVGFD